MAYPVIKPWLDYRQISDDKFEVENILFQEGYPVRFPATLVRFMQGLDGKTSPYKIDPYIDTKRVRFYLQFLSKHGYLREKTRNRDVGRFAFSIVKYDGRPRRSYLCTALNRLLLFLWLPVLVAGMLLAFRMMDTTGSLSFRIYPWGTLFGLLAGLFLHEIGHAVAAKAYMAPVYEIGVRLGLLPGAYCLLKETAVKNRLKRAQIFAAGVETNLLLAGLLCFLAYGCRQNAALRSFFFYAAFENIILAIANLCFFFPLDGFKIAATLIGADDLAASMITALIIPSSCKDELKRGVPGLAKILCVVYMLLAQSITIIWILFTVGEIFS